MLDQKRVIFKTKKVINSIGLNKAILLTILARGVQAAGGVGAIVFIAGFLSEEEQGYYFTFMSIIGIQVFFELGLSGIITQYTAHEFAKLKWLPDFELDGDEYYKSRLCSLLRFFTKWFGIISLLLAICLIPVGYYFFGSLENSSHNINWQAPWIILCLATAFNLFMGPVLAFFEGLGLVEDMAKIRLIQKGSTVLLLFIFFMLGFKLYAAAVSSLIGIGINYYQIVFSNRFKILKKIWQYNFQWKINYYTEIFPFQWKIALSWISGYFIFQLFNPVLFASDGAVVAGQMGMTLQAYTGIGAIAMSWILTKVPVFSDYIAKGEYQLLDSLFKKTVINLMMVTICLILVFNVFIFGATYLQLGFSFRFLSLRISLILSIAFIVNQYTFCLATYLRCHKKEPLLLYSVVLGILSAISTFFLGNKYGVTGMTIGYTAITLAISLPWAIIVFRNKRTLWHQ